MAAAPSPSHGLVNGKDYQLKIGTSFQPNKAQGSYHLMRYDFKPPSVDTSRTAEVQIGSTNECTVTIPNVHDSGTTTYKGGKKPAQKDCILIIDKETGEITLEKISSNISLKKSRQDRSIENNAAKVAQLKSSSLNKAKQNQSSISASTLKTASNLQHGASHTSHSHSNINTPSQSNLNSPSKHITASPSKPSTTSPNKRTTTSPNKPSATSPNKPSSLAQPNIEPKKQRRSTASTSDSYTSSSDSSDSDSSPENENQEEETFTTKPYERPPPAVKTTTPKMQPTVSNTGSFMSTLHSDLHLSDSNESDSD